MSKSLILDWQKNSLLLVRAHGRPPKVVIESPSIKSVGGVELESRTSREALREAAGQLSGKGEVTVLIARDLVELRTVQIPQMDPDDLPDVIRFQAQRQFANMTDAWIIDFVILPQTAGSEMQTALVAAISPNQLNEIESACTAAGLQAAKIVLRPIEIAHFAVAGGLISQSGNAMVVCVTESLVDLLILRDGKLLQVRSTKLPTEEDQVARGLQGELRRSMLSIADELDGKPMDSVLLVTTNSRSNELQHVIQEAVSTTVTLFHPESLLADQDASLADASANRLVGIAGSLAASSSAAGSGIDFKNPKRRPPKQRDTRRWTLAGVAAAALLATGLSWYYTQTKELEGQLASIQAELEAKKSSGEAAQRRLSEYSLIEQFTQGAPNWLDELVYISESYPGSDKIMLENPKFSINNDGTGEISFTMKSVDQKSVSEFGRSLRNEHYEVNSPATKKLPKPEGKYGYTSDTTIRIRGKGWDLNAPTSNPTSASPTETSVKPAEPKEQGENSAAPAVKADPATSPESTEPKSDKS